MDAAAELEEMQTMAIKAKIDEWTRAAERVNEWLDRNILIVMAILAVIVILMLVEAKWKLYGRLLKCLNEPSETPNPHGFCFCRNCGGNQVFPLSGTKSLGRAPVFSPGIMGGNVNEMPLIISAELLWGFCVECKNFLVSSFPEGTAEAINLPR